MSVGGKCGGKCDGYVSQSGKPCRHSQATGVILDPRLTCVRATDSRPTQPSRVASNPIPAHAATANAAPAYGMRCAKKTLHLRVLAMARFEHHARLAPPQALPIPGGPPRWCQHAARTIQSIAHALGIRAACAHVGAGGWRSWRLGAAVHALCPQLLAAAVAHGIRVLGGFRDVHEMRVHVSCRDVHGSCLSGCWAHRACAT